MEIFTAKDGSNVILVVQSNKNWNSDNARFEYQENDDVDGWKIATLIVSKMTKEDKGDYTCVLKSTLGKRANFHRMSFRKSSIRNHLTKIGDHWYF